MNRDPIHDLMFDGPPALPHPRATRGDLIADGKRMRETLAGVRLVLIGACVAQLKSGMNVGVTPDDLRELADRLEMDKS